MKYDCIILSVNETREESIKLQKELSEIGIKSISNVDSRQGIKNLFDAIGSESLVLVVIPQSIGDDEQFLELIDAFYSEGHRIISVFSKSDSIPDELLLYLGRRERMDIKDVAEWISKSLTFSNVIGKLNRTTTEETFEEHVCEEPGYLKENRVESQSGKNSNEEFASVLDNALEVINDRETLSLEEEKKLVSQLKEIANQHNSQALYLLGEFYHTGKGISQSNERATFYFDKAAKMNNVNALLALAVYNFKGLVTIKNNITGKNENLSVDQEKGIEYYKKAADMGSSLACKNLAAIFDPNEETNWTEPISKSLGITKLPNMPLAISYYERGAELNDIDCILILSGLYRTGNGVFMDIEKANQLLVKAAELGHEDSMFNLAMALNHGNHGFPRSKEEALIWYKKLAAKGSVAAMNNIAAIYYNDFEDLGQATYWGEMAYNLARGEETKKEILVNLKIFNPKKYKTSAEKNVDTAIKVLDWITKRL